MAKKLSVEEVNDVVDSEGLCVAIEECLNAGRIANASLAGHWRKAKTHLLAIQAILAGEELEDEDLEDDD